MGQLQIRTYTQIKERMVALALARSALTDLLDSSTLTQILSAAAASDDELYYQLVKALDVVDVSRAMGADLDELARVYNPEAIGRLPAQRASGTAIFSRTGTVGTVSIAAGTQIQVPATSGSPTRIYRTTAAGQITAGLTDSSPIAIEAAEVGAVGNTATGTITAFVAKPSGVDSVRNAVPLANGRDNESNDDFRGRLTLYRKSLARGTLAALEYAARSVLLGTGQQVRYATVLEDEVHRGNVVLYIDDGAGTAEATTTVTGQTVLASALGGEQRVSLPSRPVKIESAFTLYRNAVALTRNVDYVLNPASGEVIFDTSVFPTGLTAADAITVSCTYFTGLIAEVQKVIDGDPANRATYPGYRAAGTLARVLAPNIVALSVAGNLTVRSGFDPVAAIAAAQNAIALYVNGLGIGDDVVLNEIRAAVMSVPGVYDVTFTVPTANRVILDHQLARISTTDIALV